MSGQIRFFDDPELVRRSVVASKATERGPKEKQGDLLMVLEDKAKLEAWGQPVEDDTEPTLDLFEPLTPPEIITLDVQQLGQDIELTGCSWCGCPCCVNCWSDGLPGKPPCQTCHCPN